MIQACFVRNRLISENIKMYLCKKIIYFPIIQSVPKKNTNTQLSTSLITRIHFFFKYKRFIIKIPHRYETEHSLFRLEPKIQTLI